MKKILILIYFAVIIYVIYYLYEKNILGFKNIFSSGGSSANNILTGSYQQLNNLISGNSICGNDIEQIGQSYNIPSSINLTNLVRAIIYQESSGNCQAYSPVSNINAMESWGLMQLTEPVIQEYGYNIAQAQTGPTNVYIGANYICSLLEQNNYNIANALSMYNSGGLNDSTYANSVMAKYNSLNSTGVCYDNSGNAYGAIQCC